MMTRPQSSSRVVWGVVAMAVVVTALTLVMVWRIDRVEARAGTVNQTYLPVIRNLNIIQGKWQAYQRTFEQNVGFRRWGAPLKNQNAQPARRGLQKVLENNIAELHQVMDSARSSPSADQITLGNLESWLGRVEDVARGESQFFTDLETRLKSKDLTSAAQLYSSFHAKLTAVLSTDLADLNHQFDIVMQENQFAIEQELRSSQSIVLTFLIATLLLSLVVLIRLNRWIRPVEDWTRVARDIAIHGAEKVRFPEVRSGMPEEMQILTREFTRMATTVVEREKTIQAQKQRLEALVETERRLAHAKKLLLAANMSSQVAHEVRNPLNSMGLQLEMLAEDIEAALGAEHALIKRVATVNEQVQRLERITDRYLDLRGVGGDQQKKRSDTVDVHEVVENCLEFSSREIQARGVKVELTLVANSKMVRGDRDAVSQVVFNLIRNALDALDTVGAANKWIRVSSRNQNGAIVVQVQDNGPGVKAEVRQQIFEPFVTTKAQGHGLGLSVSRQICLEHGGELELAPTQTGAGFDMRLPCVS